MPTGSVLEQEPRSPPPRENGKAVETEQGKRGKWSEEEAAPAVREGNWLR